MRTRSSAKDNDNQGPESTLSPNTAEASKEAPPKAAKPKKARGSAKKESDTNAD